MSDDKQNSVQDDVESNPVLALALAAFALLGVLAALLPGEESPSTERGAPEVEARSSR